MPLQLHLWSSRGPGWRMQGLGQSSCWCHMHLGLAHHQQQPQRQLEVLSALGLHCYAAFWWLRSVCRGRSWDSVCHPGLPACSDSRRVAAAECRRSLQWVKVRAGPVLLLFCRAGAADRCCQLKCCACCVHAASWKSNQSSGCSWSHAGHGCRKC